MANQSYDVSDCTEKIIEKYAATVYRLAYAQTRNRFDTDDVFQEVFIRYCRKRPVFASCEHEKAWFLRVTVNCAKTLYFSRLKHIFVPLDESIVSDEPQDDLTPYLEKLSPDYRAVVHLFYYEGLSTDEISKLLRRKPSTVRMQLTRARRILKDIIEEDLDEF